MDGAGDGWGGRMFLLKPPGPASPSYGAAAAGHGWDQLLIWGSPVLSICHLGGRRDDPHIFHKPWKMEWAAQGPPECHSPS